MKVIGLMSGTSADGIDAALCEITGAPPRLQVHMLAAQSRPHSPSLRARILAACEPQSSSVDVLCRLHADLGEAFAQAALDLLAAAGLEADTVDLIGSHGQTVWHDVRPDGSVAATLQLTEAAVIAERTGITTISNFRARDVAAGGQGAPLTAYMDWLLLRHDTDWRAVQNIGGMANVTFLPPLRSPDAAPLAFDTGPGNALIDAAVQHLTGGAQTYDRGGEMARAGRVDAGWLGALLGHPFFRRPPPRTTGRELFGTQMALELVEEGQARGLAPADIVATLAALTAHSIADAHRRYAPAPISDVILGGGGRHNPFLTDLLAHLLGGVPLRSHEDLGLSSDDKEALAFAVLAHESWHGRPGTLPAITGATHATVLGQVTPGDNYAALSRATWQASPAAVDAPAAAPLTEQTNPRSAGLDRRSTLEILQIINTEDAAVPGALRAALPQMAAAADAIAQRLESGGRLFYIGAGTSGRLALLDAVECVPTFGTDPELVQAIIAGGDTALKRAVEGAEDDPEQARADLAARGVGPGDAVVGLAASGRTPYVVAAVETARAAGTLTAAIACNSDSPLLGAAEIAISIPVGPEVIAGSTRMKAGTAQKLALNMLSTAVMVKLGRVYDNLMVDLQVTNSKLARRAQRLVMQLTNVDPQQADALLDAAGGSVKVAIVMQRRQVTAAAARELLAGAGGHLRAVIGDSSP